MKKRILILLIATFIIGLIMKEQILSKDNNIAEDIASYLIDSYKNLNNFTDQIKGTYEFTRDTVVPTAEKSLDIINQPSSPEMWEDMKKDLE